MRIILLVAVLGLGTYAAVQEGYVSKGEATAVAKQAANVALDQVEVATELARKALD